MIFSLLTSLFKTFSERRSETKTSQHTLDLQRLEAERQQLHKHPNTIKSWQTRSATQADRVMRWAAFLLFASPLLAGLISPSFGERVLRAWHLLEPWQEKILSGMCLATFGMRSIPSLIGSIVESVRRK